MSQFLSGVGQGLSGGGGAQAPSLAGMSPAGDVGMSGTVPYAPRGPGMASQIGSGIGGALGGFGRGFLGMNPAQGAVPGLNGPSIGYGLGMLGQGGGQQNPAAIISALRGLQPQGPATRVLPAGPGGGGAQGGQQGLSALTGLLALLL